MMDEDNYPLLNKQEIQQRLDRISEIFAGIATHAEEVSKYRCPYRDGRDQCTALFRCRNQQQVDDQEVLLCGHNGLLDYRTAWETDPRAYGRAKKRIADIKKEAQAKRNHAEGE